MCLSRSAPSHAVRAIAILALVLAAGCRSGGPKPRFVHWEPDSGSVAVQHPNSMFEARVNIHAVKDADRAVSVEVEVFRPQGVTQRSVVAAKDEGGYWSAQIPTSDRHQFTRYRWFTHSASRVTNAGEPIVSARSGWRALYVVQSVPHFQVLAPPDGAGPLGDAISGDPGFVHVPYRFGENPPGPIVDYGLRVEDEKHQIQWFDRPLAGNDARTAILPRSRTFRIVPFGLFYENHLGLVMLWSRGEERVITTRP